MVQSRNWQRMFCMPQLSLLLSVQLAFVVKAAALASLNSHILDFYGGFVGCLFEDVCMIHEKCIDDNLFGKCVDGSTSTVPKSGKNESFMKLFKPLLDALAHEELQWNNLYVQCVLRMALLKNRFRDDYSFQTLVDHCGITIPEVLTDSPLEQPALQPLEADLLQKSRLHLPDIIRNERKISETIGQKNNANLPKVFWKSNGRERQFIRDIPVVYEQIGNAFRKLFNQLQYAENQYERSNVYRIDHEIFPHKSIDAAPIDKTRAYPNLPKNSRPLLVSSGLRMPVSSAPRLMWAGPIEMQSPYHWMNRENSGSHTPLTMSTHLNDELKMQTQRAGRRQDKPLGLRKRTTSVSYRDKNLKSISGNSIAILSVMSLCALIILICATAYCVRHFKSPSKKQGNQKTGQYSTIESNSAYKQKSGLFDRMAGIFKPRNPDRTNECSTEEKNTEALESCKVPITRPPTGQKNMNERVSTDKDKNKSFKFGPSHSSTSQRSSLSSWSSEPVTSGIDITTGHLILSYMEGYLHDEDRLTSDWEAVNAYEAEEATPYEDAQSQRNQRRNRPNAPFPFEQSRVRLRSTDNDYINASLLFDHNPRNPVYIATPSPMLGTLPDFWQMIWEQNSVIIVCLERPNELKQLDDVACLHKHSDESVQYWPSVGAQAYGIFEIHLVSEHNWCEDYVVRSFYLKNLETGETRTVTQFHYLAWDDENPKCKSKSLLDFRRKVNRSFRGMMSPIVVHCNDGSGRTGTYILLDLVLNRISKGVKEINIAASLEHLRDQRERMVQSKSQYEFVFAAVAEEVEAMLKTT